MAAGILQHLAKERDLDFEIQSAGLAPHPNAPVANNAVAVMGELGIDISGDYSKGLTSDTLSSADLIVVVQRSFLDHLVELYPTTASKVCSLERDVQDPMGQPICGYRKVSPFELANWRSCARLP